MIDVELLQTCAVDAKPIVYRWNGVFDEDWGIVYPSQLAYAASEEAEDERDELAPMMNYAYPLTSCVDQRDAEGIADAIHEACLPLCVVWIGDEFYLALTGGGMDLSWEICEAYILADHVPPLHFCDLPRMAGRGKSERDVEIIGACLRSASVAVMWADYKHDKLQRMRMEVTE